MRLIDADLLKENISKRLKSFNPDGTEIEVADALALVSTMMEIDEQPTAFDVDKVVEQLEDIKRKKYRACQDVICEDCKYSEDCCDGDESDKLALDMAVEIVKGGGVE